MLMDSKNKGESPVNKIVLEKECYGLAHPYKFFTRVKDQIIFVRNMIKKRELEMKNQGS